MEAMQSCANKIWCKETIILQFNSWHSLNGRQSSYLLIPVLHLAESDFKYLHATIKSLLPNLEQNRSLFKPLHPGINWPFPLRSCLQSSDYCGFFYRTNCCFQTLYWKRQTTSVHKLSFFNSASLAPAPHACFSKPFPALFPPLSPLSAASCASYNFSFLSPQGLNFSSSQSSAPFWSGTLFASFLAPVVTLHLVACNFIISLGGLDLVASSLWFSFH